MEFERAARFARCLSANVKRFRDVEIRESKRATGAVRWFVCFLPVTPDRARAMLELEQESREERALTQSFTVVADPDHDYLHVYSHASQETYEVSLAGAHCSCPDHQYRLAGTGVLCKHLIAACEAVKRGEVGEFKRIPDRRTDQERFEALFGDTNTEWMR
jgi:predicted nucleic acid-binding Zn finger protein